MTPTMKTLRSLLGWAALINYALLTLWFLAFLFAHDWMYHFHNRWFDVSVQTFNTVNYGGMMVFDMSVFLFFLAPWLALWIASPATPEDDPVM